MVEFSDLEIDIIDVLREVNMPHLDGSINLANASRDSSTGREGNWRWIGDITQLSWDQPFFRTVDGTDHTLFVLDFDPQFSSKVENKYIRNEARLREIKIKETIPILRSWVADHLEYKFFWKLGHKGIHAIQRVEGRYSREEFEKIVRNILFPECKFAKRDRIRVRREIKRLKEVGNTKEIKKIKKGHTCSSRCGGWHERDSDWVRIYKTKYGIMYLKIDLSMFRKNAQLIRWTYSPCFKIPSLITYSIPINKWSVKHLLEASKAHNLRLEHYDIPEFQFYSYLKQDEISKEQWFEGERVKRTRKRTNNVNLSDEWLTRLPMYSPREWENIPSDDRKIIERIDRVFKKGIPVIAPCILKHYIQAKKKRGNHHWSRYVIARFLGYFINSPDARELGIDGIGIFHIAHWMRFFINDKKDNEPKNLHKMKENLKYVFEGGVIPPEGNFPPSCSNMQTSGYFSICNEKMKRKCHGHTSPTKVFPKRRKIREDKDKISRVKGVSMNEDDYFGKIDRMMRKIIRKKQHSVIWKSTRAGVTTTLVCEAARQKKKIILLEPTNRIAEQTFKEALNIAYEKTGKKLIGAVFASNIKGCLTLCIMNQDLRMRKDAAPNWGDVDLAYEKLMFHTKPSCQRCQYMRQEAFFDTSTPLVDKDGNILPIKDSLISDFHSRLGLCSILTIRTQIENIDVLAMTYKRLYSLLLSESEESYDLLELLLDEFDFLVFDEFSHFTNSAYITLPVMQSKGHIGSIAYPPLNTIFDRLRYELNVVDEWIRLVEGGETDNRIALLIQDTVEAFIQEYEYQMLTLLTDEGFVEQIGDEQWIIGDVAPEGQFKHPIPHDIDRDFDGFRRNRPSRERLREQFHACHIFIENMARDINRTVPTIEQLLVLLKEDDFSLINVPSLFYKINFSFVASPKTREIVRFAQRFANLDRNRRVIVTDATMPLINSNEIFGGNNGIDFVDEVVGDPRNTNKHQLIVSDYRTVHLGTLVKGEPCRIGCRYRARDRYGALRFTEDGHPICLLHNNQNELIQGKRTIKMKKGENEKEEIVTPKCFRKLYELSEYLHKSLTLFDPKDVMIVAPNIEIYKRLLVAQRNKWTGWRSCVPLNIPKSVSMTYFRSDKTIGVKCDRRVMITICPPFTPKGSHNWLSHYYWVNGLMREMPIDNLSDELRMNDIKQSFWQTIGRAKDPKCEERSLIMCWGIGPDVLMELMNFHSNIMKDSQPEVFLTSRIAGINHFQIGVGSIWRQYNIKIPEDYMTIISSIYNVDNPKGLFTMSELGRLTGLTPKQMKQATLDSVRLPEELRQRLGWELRGKKRGGRATIIARPIK